MLNFSRGRGEASLSTSTGKLDGVGEGGGGVHLSSSTDTCPCTCPSSGNVALSDMVAENDGWRRARRRVVNKHRIASLLVHDQTRAQTACHNFSVVFPPLVYDGEDQGGRKASDWVLLSQNDPIHRKVGVRRELEECQLCLGQ